MRTPRILKAKTLAPMAAAILFCMAAASSVSSQETTHELAFARQVSDAGLQWGACPAFFPAGCEIAVLHGDPARPNADVFFRVPAQYDLPAHWHSSAERMVLVAGELHVSYEGQEPTALTAGTYAYGPARAVHHGRCVSDIPCVLFIAFEGPIDAIPVTTTEP